MKRSFQLVIGRVYQCSVVQQQLNHVQISRLAREVQRAAPSRQTAAAASVATFNVALMMMAWNFRLVVRSCSVLNRFSCGANVHKPHKPQFFVTGYITLMAVTTRDVGRGHFGVRVRRFASATPRPRPKELVDKPPRPRPQSHIFGEETHGRNFGWASSSLNKVSGEVQDNKRCDFNENRNLQLTFIEYVQIKTSVRRVRVRVRTIVSIRPRRSADAQIACGSVSASAHLC